MIRFRHAFVVLGLLLAVGCGPSDSSKEKKQLDANEKMAAENLASERQLLADPSRAAPELVRRLRAIVKMQDGVLLVDVKPQLFILPPNSPWVVDCMTAMTVVFGNLVSSYSNESGISNDVKIMLARTIIKRESCRELAPLIGKEIRAILSG